MRTQTISSRLKLVLAAVALGTALVGGTVSAAGPAGPNPTACAKSQAAVKSAKTATAKHKAAKQAAVNCAMPTTTATT